MEPNSPSRDKPSKARSHGPIARFCGVLVITTIILLSAAGAYHRFNRSDRVLGSPYFSVVVDCGSTGTRVNVYEWEIRAASIRIDLPVLLHSYPDNSTNGWKSGCRYHCIQTEPGLDKLVGNSSGIRASLEPLIHWAEGVVPMKRHQETPILVLATAGLRSLPSKDAEWILEDVEGVIKDHRFAYRRTWMRVLSGKEEAYFGWVALNYKMGILDNSSPAVTTLGLLDLGGSSLQVVMKVDEPGVDDRHHTLRSDIGSNHSNIWNKLLAVSIPEFGLNEAFDRSVAMLSGDGLGNEVRHPCLDFTFQQNYTCSNCVDERSNSSENWFDMVGEKLSKLVHVVGDPNMELCERLVKAAALNISISDWSKTITFSSCKGMAGLEIPIKSNPDLRFHALSGFFVVYNMLDLPERASMTEIWSKAQQLCSQLWTDTKNISDKQNPAPHYCFKALYMVYLITDALCVGNSDIVFGPGDVSWTLGASLVQHQQQQQKLSDKTRRESLVEMLSTEYEQVLFSPATLLVVLILASYVVYHYQVKLPMALPQRRSAAVLPCCSHLKQRPR